MPFTFVTLDLGQGYRTATGDNAGARIVLTPTAPMTNGPTVIDSPVTLSVGVDGMAARAVAATTDPGTTVAGGGTVAYRIQVEARGRTLASFTAAIPHNAGAVVDISSLIHLAAPPALTVPVSAIRAATDYDNTVAPSTGQAIIWNGTKYHPAPVAGAGVETINSELPDSAGNVVLSPSDIGAQPVSDALTRLAGGPITLTAVSGVITPNATLGYGPHRYTATADVQLADPTGGGDGEPLEVQVLASGASRVLSFASGAAPVTIPSGETWWGHLSYNAGRGKWLRDDSVAGSSGVGYTDEQVRDVMGATLVQGSNVTITPNDAGDIITISAATSGSSGIPATVVDAKGDLIAATAADTVARIGVGADGQVLTAASGAVTGLTWTTPTAAAAAGVPAYSRGVNMSGGEFAPTNTTLPGTYGTDYGYDSAAAFTAVAARGNKLARLPIRWERIQPTRNAALASAELTRVLGVVSDIAAAGMKAVPEIHNFGRFIVSGGAELVLGTDLPAADLVDLWTRLSTAFKGNAGIYAYGLMNEPHDLAAVPGTFSGTVRYPFATTVEGWVGEASAAVTFSSGKARVSKALGAGSVNLRANDGATVAGGTTPTGSVVRFELTPVALPAGTWTATGQWQNSSFAYQAPTSVVMTRIDTGAVVTSLTVGQGVYVTATFASIASPPNAFAVEVDGTGATAGTVTVDIDNFSQGSTSGAKTGAQVWEDASQQVVTAIRGNADTTKLLVPGYGFSGAQVWTSNHALPWITDPANAVEYEAHYYFDGNNSGVYAASYATENTAAVSAGYASLTARALAEMSHFTDWLTTNSVKGFIGEIGWPNTGDTTSWNAVGTALYQLLDTKNVDATYWAAGARWGTTYLLSAYTGTAQDVVKSQAAVIEAHLTPAPATLQSQIDGLTSRLTADETTLSGIPFKAVNTSLASPVVGKAVVVDSVTSGVPHFALGTVSGGGGAGVTWRGPYASGTAYVTNDAVSYSGSAFIATGAATGTAPGNPAAPTSPWQLLASAQTGPQGAPGLVWRGAWASGTTYAAGDAINYSGRSWYALAGSTGTTPPTTSTSTATWSLLADIGSAGPAGSGAAGLITPTDLGFVAWSFDPTVHGGDSSSPPSGELTGVLLKLPACTITALRYHIWTAGAGLTTAEVGLIDVATKNRIAQVTGQATNMQGTGAKRAALGSSATYAGGLVYGVVLAAGTTLPVFASQAKDTGMTNAFASGLSFPARAGRIGATTGLTTIPATVSDLTTGTQQGNRHIWFAVEGS